MIELALIGVVVIALIVFVVWLALTSKKEGRTDERERAQRKALEDAETANQVARDVHRRRASDRLQDEWQRE